jgi:hypothetical protein
MDSARINAWLHEIAEQFLRETTVAEKRVRGA